MTSASPHSDERLRRLLLSVTNRRRIYEAIARTPGMHVRRLQRVLGLAFGSVQHHLRQLELHGLVFAHDEGRRKTYYCAHTIDPEDAEILHVLNRPPCDDILAALILGGEGSVSDVAASTGVPKAQTSHHLRRMLEAGLLENLRVGRQSMYFVVDPERILHLMQRHFPGMVHSMDGGLHHLIQRTEAVNHRIRTTGYPVPALDAPTIEPIAPTIEP